MPLLQEAPRGLPDGTSGARHGGPFRHAWQPALVSTTEYGRWPGKQGQGRTRQMQRRLSGALGMALLLIAGPLVGCSDDAMVPTNVNCPSRGWGPAIVVSVEDAVSGSLIDSALAVATDGSFADSAWSLGDPPRANLAWSRPGTYEVVVEKKGYTSWARGGIEAVKDTSGWCPSLRRVEITARLMPL